MIDKIIKAIKENGLIGVAPLRFIGKAKPTLEMLAIINDTEPEETDLDWWTLRMYLRRN